MRDLHNQDGKRVMGIDWRFEEKPVQKLFNYASNEGFRSKSAAKKHINSALKSFSCSNCGNRRLNGANVLVDTTKTHLYLQKEKKGVFGMKIVDKFDRTVFFISDPYLATGGFFGGKGWIKCNSCGQKSSGFNSFWGQWAANLKDAYNRGDFR